MIGQEKIALLIDGANLYSATKALGFDIDYKRLLKEFQSRGYLLRAFYYTTIIEDQEYSSIRPLLDWLDYNGYSVVTKIAREFTDAQGRRRVRGSMDIEIAVDAMELAGVVDHIVLFSGDGITTDEFATIGGPGVEGTLMTFPPDPQKRPEAAAVVQKFAAKNFKPEAYTLYSYAAVQVMAEGAKRANSLDPKKVAEALRGGAPVKTVIGDLAFDKKGDITRPDYTMYTWKKGADGKITYIEN
ncbi:MAG: hypothetical protein B7Z40_19465 [Bosea sp. 12-68-7]|nr:MAG: hypothetical protein B7Z40_19465 [Bosea sp. 12-68-7]